MDSKDVMITIAITLGVVLLAALLVVGALIDTYLEEQTKQLEIESCPEPLPSNVETFLEKVSKD